MIVSVPGRFHIAPVVGTHRIALASTLFRTPRETFFSAFSTRDVTRQDLEKGVQMSPPTSGQLSKRFSCHG